MVVLKFWQFNQNDFVVPSFFHHISFFFFSSEAFVKLFLEGSVGGRLRIGTYSSLWLRVPVNMLICVLSNKNLSMCSTSLVTREKQVGTASHPLRMAVIKRMDKNKCC